MAAQDSEAWLRARHARDLLAGQLLHRRDVQMIDIGSESGTPEQLVLRVYVEPSAQEIAGLPSEVEGIPVRVLVGGFKVE